MKGDKLGVARKYRHRLRVTFSGRFPVDMLRFDRAHPATEGDALTIEESVYDYEGHRARVVMVDKYSDTANGRDPRVWTVQRWASFGVSVELAAPEETIDRLAETEG